MYNCKSISYKSPHSLANIKENAPVLLALSGGADSRALLHVLSKDAKDRGYTLHAAHFNHKIRGNDAEKDEELCTSLAKEYGVPLYIGFADIPSLAKESGRGIENEARYRRYDFFEKVMRENNIPILVTAHHADDQIESILLHILRGSGISGVKGMSPCRPFGKDMLLVRPFLETKKADILEYCKENKLEFAVDSTNDDTNYKRNAIRKNVTPALYEIQPSLISVFNRLSESAEEADDYLNRSAAELVGDCGDGISLNAFNSAHKALKARALAIEFANHSESTLERVHIKALIELAERSEAHASISLPDKMKAEIEYGKLVFKKEEAITPSEPFFIPFFEGEKRLSPRVTVKIEKDPKDKCPNNSVSLDLKSEILENGAFLRSRKEGDTIQAGKMNKKVKKLVSEKKIPLSLRDQLPILAREDEILWIPTVAVCDRVKMDTIRDGESFYRITVKFEND